MALEPRALCETCGHTREWHDREMARRRLGAEPSIDRPCFREVGGAPCRCGGFRDSGEFALPRGAGAAAVQPTSRRLVQNALLTFLLVVMGLLLLYAYRSQTPSVPQVSLTQAVQEIQSGKVRAVTIVGTRATLELANGTRMQTTIPEVDQVLAKAVTDYNSANPAHKVELRYQAENQTFSVVVSIVLSLLPVLLIGAFFLYLMRNMQRR